MAHLPAPTTPSHSVTLSPSSSPFYTVGARAPATPPPPPELQPTLLRYPETVGTLIEIRESEGRGLGVFALCDIPPGTGLLFEAPLVTLIDTGTRADPLDAAVMSLSPEQRASFLSLSHYSRNPNESVNRSIVYSNGYSIMKDLATGIFETASRINHSCVPNSAYVWKGEIGRMVFWNRWKLLEGEEVTVDYGHKRGQLRRIYGFDCSCGGCTDDGTSVGSNSSSWKGSESGGEGMRSLDMVVQGCMKGNGVTGVLDIERREIDEEGMETGDSDAMAINGLKLEAQN